MFKPLSLVIVSTLLVLPAGIAKVNALDVQSDTTRVNFDRNGGMHIESADGGTIDFSGRTTPLPDFSGSSTQTAPINRSYPWTGDRTTFSFPRSSQMHCSSSGYSEHSSHSSQSGTGISQSYSSTTTSVCH